MLLRIVLWLPLLVSLSAHFQRSLNVNSLEWNDGLERWNRLHVLEWSTGLDYWSATPINQRKSDGPSS